MIKWLWRLIWGRPTCEHEWEIYERIIIVNDDEDNIGRVYDLRCNKCGDMCSREFRP